MPNLPPQVNIPTIVNEVLQETGILSTSEQFSNSLDTCGVTVDYLAQVLADLLINGREQTRLKALQVALSARGISLQPSVNNMGGGIVVNINVGNNQLNTLFAPERSL